MNEVKEKLRMVSDISLGPPSICIHSQTEESMHTHADTAHIREKNGKEKKKNEKERSIMGQEVKLYPLLLLP